jgi:hypothetical protein
VVHHVRVEGRRRRLAVEKFNTARAALKPAALSTKLPAAPVW